ESAIRALRPAHVAVEISLPAEQRVEVHPVDRARKSLLAAGLVKGRLVTSVEITPPKGFDTSRVMAGAKMLKGAGVDAINIPDGPRASARMSAQALAVILEQQVGIETILHYCCRDRNLLGMQSDLLGAAALGLKNLLIITGDPPKMGDYPDATAVFDVDAIGLKNVVTRLNHGLDLGEDAEGRRRWKSPAGRNRHRSRDHSGGTGARPGDSGERPLRARSGGAGGSGRGHRPSRLTPSRAATISGSDQSALPQ